jgi:putative ABC transport system permease protein
MSTLLTHLRIVARSLLREPIATATIVATLAICIGATVSVFSIVDAVRLLQPADDAADAPRVVVLDDAFWQRQFARDPRVVGTAVRLNGESYTVVGVLPRVFPWPLRSVDVIVPLVPDRDPRRHVRTSTNFLRVFGRLERGATPASAERELTGLTQELRRAYPREYARKVGVAVTGLHEQLVGDHRQMLVVLLARVGFMLGIALANVLNLLLVRATARQGEIAIRRALGASQAHVVRRLLAEGTLLAAAGSALGLLLANGIVTGIAGTTWVDLPRLDESRVNIRAVVFVAGLTAATAAMLRSFVALQRVELGYRPDSVFVARVSLSPQKYRSVADVVRFHDRLSAALEAQPGVVAAGVTSVTPLSGLLAAVPFAIEGQASASGDRPSANFRAVSPGHLAAIRVALVAGRAFTERDDEASPPVAIVSRALVARFLPNVNPIGQRLLIDDNDTGPRPVAIVGVVRDLRHITLDGPPTHDIFIPLRQIHPDGVGTMANSQFWTVRLAGDPGRYGQRFAAVLREVDGDAATSGMGSMQSYVDASRPSSSGARSRSRRSAWASGWPARSPGDASWPACSSASAPAIRWRSPPCRACSWRRASSRAGSPLGARRGSIR